MTETLPGRVTPASTAGSAQVDNPHHARRWLIAANTEHAVISLDPGAGAPAGDQRVRQCGVEKINRHSVIQHPAHPDVSEIKLVFSIPPDRPTPNFPPSWNVAPTDSLPVVRYDAKAGERSLGMLRWGLVPYWAKDLNVGFANINAKAERD